MTVRKQKSGKWLFEKYLEGGRRVCKTFVAIAEKGVITEQEFNDFKAKLI